MKNIKLNLNLVFGNEDLPQGKNFNKEFNSLTPKINEYLNKLIELQTSVASIIPVGTTFTNFNTSHQCKQSFLVRVEVSEKTFFGMKILGIIYSADGTPHVFTPGGEHSVNAPVWFDGFTEPVVSTVTPVSTLTTVPTLIRTGNPSVGTVVSENDKPAPKVDAPIVRTTTMVSTAEHDAFLNHVEDIQALIERVNIPADMITTYLNFTPLTTAYITGKRNDYSECEVKSLIENALALKKAFPELIEKAKKIHPAKTGGNEVASTPSVKPQEEKLSPELIRKNGFIDNAYRYIDLINGLVDGDAAYRLLQDGKVSLNFIQKHITKFDLADFKEAFVIEQLARIRKVYEQVKAQVEAKEKEANDPRKQLRDKVCGIFDYYRGKTVVEIVKILGTSVSYYYRFRSADYTTFSLTNYTRLVQEIVKAHDANLVKVFKKEQDKKEADRLAKLSTAVVPVKKADPLKTLAEINTLMIAMKVSDTEIAELTAVDIDKVKAIISRQYSKVPIDQVDTIKELTLIGVKALEEKKKAQKASKVTGLGELGKLSGLVKKSAHPSGVLIPKFDKAFYATADTELRARYGKNCFIINTTAVSKYFNENRKRLLTISKNSIEIANITGIESTVINRSMKHGSMVPGRDVYAVHLYLESITTELEAIRNSEVCQ